MQWSLTDTSLAPSDVSSSTSSLANVHWLGVLGVLDASSRDCVSTRT